MKISSLANIHPEAIIAENVVIEAFATIGKEVEIGEGSWIGPNAVIFSGSRVGQNCKIFPGAVIGADPQDLKYAGEETHVVIGDNVVVREYCTINRGTAAYGKTVVESNILLMAYVHVAHDCHIKSGCILSNAVNLAGHVIVNENTIIGGMTAIQQFVRIGQYCYIGGGSKVRKDIPPFVKAARDPISYVGVNRIGLDRNGFETDAISRIQDIYRCLYVKGWNITQAISHIASDMPGSPEKQIILDFINSSEGGIMRGFNSLSE
ncbi:MAG: acyl-ACP--UDP-N-acetylglucosamine O-acyltransferase [Saprospiraceae bacterium]|nr:acyl-ACP--UDP-N-acetylglucosamine O-acyltransferase [Bacteroidia bacterium]NNF21756.1 acyl-ACP--UDP-N-acetylglucosamine O-acyltransferase [Saprospiraceae bacterium]NNK90786.1 acyl-ACP--UDP-N-acetylglucosamine O-acyltransferase [Saprospiraceae bacterium]